MSVITLGAVHMSQASPVNTGLTRFFCVLWWLKYSGELQLKGIAALSNTKAYHEAK